MLKLTKKIYYFGDMATVFADNDGTTQLVLVPKGTEDFLNEEKLVGLSPLGVIIDKEPLVHIAKAGDGYAGDFSAGLTQRNSRTSHELRIVSQKLSEKDSEVCLITESRSSSGLIVRQYILYQKGSEILEMYNEVENSGKEVLLESLPSFCISAISPFSRFDNPQKMILYKMLSNWSGEGKIYAQSFDKISFEPPWSGLGLRLEKWSQVGTMPARGQLPFTAVEDAEHKVCWGVNLQAPASWELEIAYRNDNISLSGGMADYLTGHWRKKLKNGEVFRSKKAFVSVAKGGLNEICNRFVKYYNKMEECKPCEKELPVLYNEYCYSWGKPTEEKLKKILPIAAKLGCKYFVIDDGWFVSDSDGGSIIGDWNVSKERFPHGLKAFSEQAESYGMKLGIWYEFEGVSERSKLYREHPDWLLTYNGVIINHNGRAFLDFRKQETIQYLREKVIQNLSDNHIGYMKVDYNSNVGLGADGAESYGEALRQHMNAVLAFFREIKKTLPDLVLEICSSGGMRHEAEFLSLADMVSFSDAHECASGVNIAFNLHRYIPPRKMQIWATIREDYSIDDIRFTLAKAMLGRVCLSGNLETKSPAILSLIEESLIFYKKLTPILAQGTTTIIEDKEITSYFCPVGSMYLIRESTNKDQKIVYAYSIDKQNSNFLIEVGNYRVKDGFSLPAYQLEKGFLTFQSGSCQNWGSVFLLEKI